LFINHLVSHGFVVAAPSHEDTAEAWKGIVDRPLDVVFVLNQLAELEGNELADIIDTEKVGVTGFSFGGYTSLAVGGARLHPNYFLDWCTIENNAELADYCALSPIWDEFSAYREQYIPP
jgi:predicted dienelactone hydrolase